MRPTDVFIVGHPKSGNTWIAYMLAVILEGGDVGRQVTMANIGHFITTIHRSDSQVSSYDALSEVGSSSGDGGRRYSQLKCHAYLSPFARPS